MEKELTPAALIQGGYYFLTGIWPLISIRTFQKVTGPKRDLWLVKTVGVVIAAIGTCLLVAGSQREVASSVIILAVGSAFGLTCIDIIYVKKRIISSVYLADAAAELLLIALWVFLLAV